AAEARNMVAHSHINIAVQQAAQDRPAEALASYRQAQTLLEELQRGQPRPEWQRGLGAVHSNRGLLLKDQPRQVAAARKDLERADTLNNVGIALAKRGKKSEALRCHEQALAMRAKVARNQPGVVEWQRALAASHYNIGMLLAALGKRPEALKAHQQALDLRQK